jgi:hypothetical protein
MLENTPIYWYSVEESNVIDPVAIDRVNKFMKENGLVTLSIKDVKQGIRLRLLQNRYDQKVALEKLLKEEEESDEEMNYAVEEITKGLEEGKKALEREKEQVVPISDYRNAISLLSELKERKLFDEKEYTIYLQKVDKGELTYQTLIDELKLYHQVSIIKPLDIETEKFIYDLGKQHAVKWAGISKDLRDTKRGLKEMLSSPIKSYLSWYLMIFGSVFGGMLKDSEIELHYSSSPVAILLDHRKIIIKKIITKGKYFVINDRKIGGVFAKSLESQYMWGKTPCYIYNVTGQSSLSPKTIKEFLKYAVRRTLRKTIKKKRQIINRSNTLIDHLESIGKLESNEKIQLQMKIDNDQIDFDTLVEELESKGKIQITRALNVEVEGFIDELGSINAQEWAGHTQDLRNNLKNLKDMTAVPTKSFISAGMILAGGIVAVMAVAVFANGGGSGITKMFGGTSGPNGTHTGISLIPNFGGHLILGSDTIFSWISLHTPWLLEWLI